jgi:3-oxoacyl-[acyl-carrier-protein] synthase II
MGNKVVITGIGTVNPVGNNVGETWDALLAGRSGIDRIQSFDPEEHELRTHVAGEVKDFDPSKFIGKKEARKIDRFSQLALVAANEAYEQSRLELTDELRYDVGTIVASGVGGAITLVDQAYNIRDNGPRRVNPFTIPMLMPNAASGLISIRLGTWGPAFATVSACASSADSIGMAYEMIKSGRVKAMVAGGSEASIIPLCIAGFEQARALCTDSNDRPTEASRPFDATRSGFVLAEGAAIMVLENEEFARSRGADILAEAAGYGSAADGYHITAPAPDGRGAVHAISMALRNAELNQDEVCYINAHGTSTPLNDKVESMVIREVFGTYAEHIPISSTKSMTGHLGGAAGAIEAVACAKTIETGWAAPTINYREKDPECDLDYIPGDARQIKPGAVLSNSFGFGGHNSCLIFRSYS